MGGDRLQNASPLLPRNKLRELLNDIAKYGRSPGRLRLFAFAAAFGGGSPSRIKAALVQRLVSH